MTSRAIGAVFLFAVCSMMGDDANAQNPPLPVNQWTVDLGNLRCSLGRRIGGAQSPVLAVSTQPGRDRPELLLLREGTDALPALPSRVSVTLLPSGHRENVGFERQSGSSGGLITYDLAPGFIDRFAATQSIQVESRGRTFVSLPTPGAAAAIARLRTCEDSLLRSWGLDRSVRSSWRREPEQIGGNLRSNDYPRQALRERRSGYVVARFTIGVNGRATNCVVAFSSGSRDLDDETCAIITARWRFAPALNADGEPLPAIEVQTFRWILPL